MKIKGLILGQGEIVKNGNTLKAMNKQGHIIFPVDESKNPYVDFDYLKPRIFDYKNNKYEIKYFDGCFFPFVVKL